MAELTRIKRNTCLGEIKPMFKLMVTEFGYSDLG